MFFFLLQQGVGGEREFSTLLADRNLDGNTHLGKAYPDFSNYPGSDWFLKFCIVFKALKEWTPWSDTWSTLGRLCLPSDV